MIRVNVTELRNNLPTWLRKVKTGEEVVVTSRGKIIARLVPEVDESKAARLRLVAVRGKSWVGDVLAPTGETWEAEGDTP
jgi:prevent-host-death family protein